MTTEIHHQLGWHMRDFSDFKLKLVINGPAFVLKNSKQIIHVGGSPRIVSNSKANRYLQDAATQLWNQWRAVFLGPLPPSLEINAAIVTYLPTRRLADASNLYEAPQDAMKSHTEHCKDSCKKHGGVLVDDAQIRTHNGSDRRYDKDNPRVEITLTPYRGAVQGAA